jgi:hypothetical protein
LGPYDGADYNYKGKGVGWEGSHLVVDWVVW